MRVKLIQHLAVATALATCALPEVSFAASTSQLKSHSLSLELHFAPRPSKATRIDYDAWNFILGETVLYMGPSTRTRTPPPRAQLGTRQVTSHTSPYRLEGNKVMYSLFTNEVKSGMQAYATELIELGNRLDIPSLSKGEQLAYWINLHNAVLITTISQNYPPPHRRPSLIKPIKGSKVKLHDAKLIHIDGYSLSLRDIRENIVFPNWKNQDVPFAFHLGYLGSPSMANYAYTASKLNAQLKNNAEEFVNSLRAYHNGELNLYFSDVSPWYFPEMKSDLDRYFRKRMRSDVYLDFSSDGIRKTAKEDLTLADITGGLGKVSSISQLESAVTQFSIGSNVDQFLAQRVSKFEKLKRLEWFKNSFVTIIDTPIIDGEETPEVE